MKALIRRTKNREIDHSRKFSAAMRRSLPGRSDVDLYWGLHFALTMAHQTIRDSERLAKLSDGLRDLNDVAGGAAQRATPVSVTKIPASPALRQPMQWKHRDNLIEPKTWNSVSGAHRRAALRVAADVSLYSF